MANQQDITQESMLRTGTVLHDTYRIDSYLSSGGFGNTYVATHILLGTKRAIKEFFMKGVTQRADNTSMVSVSNSEKEAEFRHQLEKFKKEAQRLCMLDNKNIVKVHDLFEENGTAYYVMDYIEGEDMRHWLARNQRPMSEEEVMKILPQVLHALEDVHSKNIWHLDLKPANILMDGNMTVKLIDFGASKQFDNESGGVTSSAVAYTNGYAPFEQMEMNHEKFGPWTDFYTLGASLYNLLSNKKPSMPSDIIDDHTPDKRKALPLPAGVSDKMKNLILWLMKPNYKERPQSVHEIRNYFGFSSDETHVAVDSDETVLTLSTATLANEPQNNREWLKLLFGILLGVLFALLFSWAYHKIKNTDSVEHDYIENLKLSDKSIYSGEVIKGTDIRDGWGHLVIISNGDTTNEYEGDWKEDKLIYGTRKTKSSDYEGQFNSDLSNHGFGKITYSKEHKQNRSNNGVPDSEIDSIYIGNWNMDRKHGLGLAIKQDGSMEFGEYRYGEFQQISGANYKVGDRVYGIDVSHHQSNIDWDNLALFCDEYGNVFNHGFDEENKKFMQPVFFVYLKATDGDSIRDEWYYVRNKEAEDHGIVKGAFHYFRYDKDIESQVNKFLETVSWSIGDLPPALDVEKEAGVKYDVETLHEKVLYWLKAVEEKKGIQPIIYTNNEFFKEYFDVQEFKKYKFWVARYNDYDIEPSNSDWQFWQKSETARMRGYDNYIDVNLFNGNYESFQRYIEAVGNSVRKH